MKRLRRLLNKLLFPRKIIVLVSVPVSALLLGYTFLFGGEDNPAAYFSYVFSAYSLTIVCGSLASLAGKIKGWVHQNPYADRYLEDVPFKVKLSLHLSLGINLLYAGAHGISGVRYHSAWFGTLSAYYLFLAVMRFLLVKHVHQKGFCVDQRAEWKQCRLCGGILILMNMALTGVVILVLSKGNGFYYGGSLIYVMALYTFYITIMSVVNVVRYRKYQSPAMWAAKAVNLAAALVSMLSLEIAMLTQFDDGSKSGYFRALMIGATGGTICTILVGMGGYMIVRSTKELRRNP